MSDLGVRCEIGRWVAQLVACGDDACGVVMQERKYSGDGMCG